MTRILIAGYQHETNTFAPSLADWAAFNTGENFPAYVRGQAMVAQMTGLNIPVGGFIDAARREGWQLLPSAWAGATPSSYVTRDAFERISAAILEDVRAAMVQGLDGVYLDLHGAAVADHADDSEGELIARIRAVVGPRVPIVARTATVDEQEKRACLDAGMDDHLGKPFSREELSAVLERHLGVAPWPVVQPGVGLPMGSGLA